MFLVRDQRYGTTYLVFTWEDPRKNGYTGNLIEDVRLDYDMEAVHTWADGQARPEAVVGQAPDDPKRYKVFKYRSERQAAGYHPVTGTPVIFGSWSDYVRLHLDPPDPDQTDDERWYEYLDKLDEVSRRRRQQAQDIASPTNGSRDEVAVWLAKRHFIADNGIREVWYLPHGAPPEEIRLLEVNDRLASNESKVEPIDFGLEVGEVHFLLFVADITSNQLAQIKQDPSRLPPGWSLAEAKSWRRGA
jgi:hypothetical protein